MHFSHAVLRRILLTIAVLAFLSGCASAPGNADRWINAGAYEVVRNNEIALFDPVQEREVTLQVTWPDSAGPL